MFIVLSPSESERGPSKNVQIFTNMDDLRGFLLQTRCDLARLDIFKAERVRLELEIIND